MALARSHTVAAITALAEALKDPKTRVPAAGILLNRAWGMPTQTVRDETSGTVALHMLAARAISDHLARTRSDVPTASTIEGTPVAGHSLLDAPQPTE